MPNRPKNVVFLYANTFFMVDQMFHFPHKYAGFISSLIYTCQVKVDQNNVFSLCFRPMTSWEQKIIFYIF